VLLVFYQNLEPAMIQLTSKVATCKTFKEFLMMWTRYRIAKQVIADDLTADGDIHETKVMMAYIT
jgi:hypothetical protein